MDRLWVGISLPCPQIRLHLKEFQLVQHSDIQLPYPVPHGVPCRRYDPPFRKAFSAKPFVLQKGMHDGHHGLRDTVNLVKEQYPPPPAGFLHSLIYGKQDFAHSVLGNLPCFASVLPLCHVWQPKSALLCIMRRRAGHQSNVHLRCDLPRHRGLSDPRRSHYKNRPLSLVGNRIFPVFIRIQINLRRASQLLLRFPNVQRSPSLQSVPLYPDILPRSAPISLSVIPLSYYHTIEGKICHWTVNPKRYVLPSFICICLHPCLY